MKVRIGLVDGRIEESDDIPEVNIQADIDAVGGLVGNGAFSKVRVEEVDDFVAMLDRMCGGEVGDYKFTELNLVQNGKDIVYNTTDIVWHRIIRDYRVISA